MNELKQRLAERIKKAAEEKKKQAEVIRIEAQNPQSMPMPAQIPTFQQQEHQELPKEQEQIEAMQEEHQSNLEQSKKNEPAQHQMLDQNDQQDGDEELQVLSYRERQQIQNPFIVQTPQPAESWEEIDRQIKVMISQKQNRTQEQEDEQKKRQLILSVIKQKKKPRPPRPMDKPTPFNELSPPYQQIKIFASYLPIYEQRRRRQHYSTVIDLGVKNLQQIITQCFLEGIISKNFMKSIKNISVEHQMDFIRKFAENRLKDYNFVEAKFTPLDHRWLCGRLLNLPDGRGQKYILGERIYCVFKEITDFYQIVYRMPEEKYQRLCEGIRIKYNLHWREGAFSQNVDLSNIEEFDTSFIFQMRPSPMFGADCSDDQKQFFKAKKQRYPEKVKNAASKESKPSGNKAEKAAKQSSSSSESLQESYEDSLQESLQKQLEMQSELQSSIYKSSTIKSIKKSGRKSEFSLSEMRDSSMMSDLFDQSDEDEMSMRREPESESVARSVSQSERWRKPASRNQKPGRKAMKKEGRQDSSRGNVKQSKKPKPSSQTKAQMRLNSQAVADDNIFQDN